MGGGLGSSIVAAWPPAQVFGGRADHRWADGDNRGGVLDPNQKSPLPGSDRDDGLGDRRAGTMRTTINNGGFNSNNNW